MSDDCVITTVEAPVGRLILNRPQRRNALSLDLMGTLTMQAHAVAADPDVAVIVVEGRGPAFSAGHDISEMAGRDDAFYRELFGACTAMMTALRELPQPVIAKVHGVATAAGCQLVASCDLAVASEEATFATPGVRIGLFCFTPMVPISRAVGQKRALEMLLTGNPITAETALEWGLVNRVVPADDLDAAVDDLAASITRWSPGVIGNGKAAFYRQEGCDEAAAYGVTEPIMATNAGAASAQEGFAAFLEKRAPVWPDHRT